MVVTDGETETDTPVPTGVPPHVPEYHCHIAPAESVPVKPSVDDAPAEQKNVGEALIVAGAVGVGFTIIITLLQFEKQPLFSART